jgi:DNA mismatch endonuclease (patch repair protein)
MRANRRTDTKPEMALRRALHGQGLRYRKDYRLDLDGARVRPDIAFTARRVAVFVDGCFWHACPEHGTKPASNTWYWGPKLARNVERDRAADAALVAAGWQVVRVWEHVPLDAAVAAVVGALTPGAAPAAADAPVPADDAPVPADDAPVPADDAPVPADDGPVPADDAAAPEGGLAAEAALAQDTAAARAAATEALADGDLGMRPNG